MEKNVFIYARISRDDGKENIKSLEAQIDLLKEYAWNKLGRRDCAVFADDNVTGASLVRVR